jgi:hydroxylaminobenzene mutase
MFVQSMTNPRMGLTTHVGTVMTGTFLLAVGAVWSELRLSPSTERATFWLLLFGTYGSCASLLLAAVLGTKDATPIAGAGFGASPGREALVTASLSVTAFGLLVACALVLRGLGRRAA